MSGTWEEKGHGECFTMAQDAIHSEEGGFSVGGATSFEGTSLVEVPTGKARREDGGRR